MLLYKWRHQVALILCPKDHSCNTKRKTMKVAAIIVVGISFCVATWYLPSAATADDTRSTTDHRRVRKVLIDLDSHGIDNSAVVRAGDLVEEDPLEEFWARDLEGSFGSMPTLESDLVAFWYKPHYQCDGSAGTTPQGAADFINKQLVGGDKGGADFLGISEWVVADNISIGNPAEYGTIGSVCGYGVTDYTTPVALFYKLDAWTLDDSYPKSPSCNFVPVPPWTGPQIGDICVNKTQPDGDNCCSCTFSEKEYSLGNDIGQNLGQRPWVAGIFSSKISDDDGDNNAKTQKVCVVAGEITHPLFNSTLSNLNGKTTSDPKPNSIAQYLCTLLNTRDCVPNLTNSSILFGTDVLVPGVSEFCGNNPVIFMADTNAGMGYISTGSMFSIEPLMSLEGYSPLSPYTCCNDTLYGGELNVYASDRIDVSGSKLTIDLLEGGSSAPAGSLPGDMTYYCHASEEHSPLRAHISFKN